MGRNKLSAPSEDVQAMDLIVQKQEEEQLSIQQVEEAYGDGQPYERLRLENEIRFFQQQMADSLLETGKRLLRLKANEGHGGFMKCLENIGISDRSARYAMAAARKFANRQTTAILGSEKLRALTVLDDDSIQTLEDGGKVADVTIDEIEKMTVRELKEKLREEKKKRKEEREAQETAIAKKEEKINDLERQVRYQEPPTKEKIAQNRLDEFRKDFIGALASATYEYERLNKLIADMQEIENIGVTQLDAFIGDFGEHMQALQDERIAFEEDADNIHPTWNKHTEE